jgi:Zn-dependent M16 (insulinase) family peptidase
MAVVPDDLTQDATFGVSFRTPLADNRGLATTTEYSVQAGSKTYPVRDPINRLQAGSLQTHLETWSEADRTSFTMASRNLKDFKNSMAVVLDGIFHPLLGEPDHEWIYRQEGWRLETKEDQTTLFISG